MFWNKKIQKSKDNKKLQDIIFNYKKNNNQFKAKEMLKFYNVCKPKNMFDIKGHKNKLIYKYNKNNSFLINMQLTNGNIMHFIIKVTDGGFKFDKGFYIIDDEQKYYVSTSNIYALDYHEELCFPIKRTIDVNNIKDEIIKGEDIELKTAINPVSLQSYMESSVIQQLLAGAELDKALRFIKMAIIIIGIIVIINLLLTFNLSGLF